MEYKLYLASSSPRRHDLLRQMGLPFEIIEQDFDENYPDDLPVEHVSEYIARNKALSIDFAVLPSNALVITCDTTVVLGQRILGKPVNEADAFEMIQSLSGKSHQVVTGVCLRSIDKESVFSGQTTVHFRTLKDDEIRYYISHYQPMDKAGAYGIQEWIGFVGVERIEGSYYNVMGMPTQMLYTRLMSF